MQIRFPPANPEILALGSGGASGMAANELAPWAGGAGPGSFKPLARGPVGRQCWALWPQPSPRPACPCRGWCVCPWSIPPVPCAWLAWRPWWTFMGKSQRPGPCRPLVLSPWVLPMSCVGHLQGSGLAWLPSPEPWPWNTSQSQELGSSPFARKDSSQET